VLLFTNLHRGTHVQYTNLHGGTQPVHESLIYSTHPPLRLFRPTTLTNISTACISSIKVDGAWLTLPYNYPSPASRAAVIPTSPLHAGQLYLHHRCYQSPRLLVKVEAYDSASNNHQYSMYFLGTVDPPLPTSTLMSSPHSKPNLSPSTLRSSLYFHTHVRVQTGDTAVAHTRPVFFTHRLYTGGRKWWVPTASPLRLQDGRVLTAGFYHRRLRATNYTNLHMASGYLLLRHYQQPVEPNLQRHPYTTIGAVPYMAHG